MIICMQGNWTVTVKTKSASFAQRFVITGATAGNGIHNGVVGTSVNVTGIHWAISIQHDPGTGFRASDSRIKFPVVSGGNYVFDIESNDSGGDLDFNDLILNCSTPVMSDDYLIYGHVKDYSGLCIYNPCFSRYLVIETAAALQAALRNPLVKAALTQLYPERVLTPVIINPNPPDPAPFIPMIINLLDSQQIPSKTASIFRPQISQKAETETSRKSSRNKDSVADTTDRMDSFAFDKNITLSSSSETQSAKFTYDKVGLASIIDNVHLFCTSEDVTNQTLNFQEYDRTTSELGGGPYTGGGNRLDLGFAVTDMNGNYIFRFKQTFSELVNEIFNDVGVGENVFVQARPDIIVRIPDTNPSFNVLFESAPYFNVPNLKRIDLCFPKSVLHHTQLCANGNLIGQLGNVFIGGPQNQTNIPQARVTALNALKIDGKITVHDTTSSLVDCGCWVGRIDLKGCMNNPNAVHYTIRHGKTAGSWDDFVSEEYHHPKVSNYNTNSPGTKVGPFLVSLKVDGGVPQTVHAYTNIQREAFFLGADWIFDSIDRYIQLTSSLYEAGVPGTVYFRVDAYDSGGNPISSDMISLYIDNSAVDAIVSDAFFNTSVDNNCVLFNLTEAEMTNPLRIFFKANHLNGFLNYYAVYMGKGKFNSPFPTTDSPVGGANGNYNPAGDPFCAGFIGSANKFGGSTGIVELDLTPASGGWLAADEEFCTFVVNLTYQKRCTDGYSVCGGVGPVQFIFGIKRA
jgi:hypothetical protein